VNSTPGGYPFGPATPGAPVPPRRPRLHWIEDILILAAIGSLWPTVLRKTGPWVTAIQIVTLAVMMVILVARGRRLAAARRRAEEDARRL